MKTFHAFVSYTSREEEVRIIQPIVDKYCHELWLWAKERGIHVFYDQFCMEKRRYSEQELTVILGSALARAQFFVGFISPCYVESRWCCFEWRFGPMRDVFSERLHLPTQAVNWKPDYRESDAFDPGVPRDVRRRAKTDVRYAYNDPVQAPRAVAKAVRDAQRILEPVFWSLPRAA